MNTGKPIPDLPWHAQLETIGTELFLRYRKRLMEPGITLEIRAAYPGHSLVDLLIRVNAGRRLIREGADFRALQAIHDGQWAEIQWARARQGGEHAARGDGLSRFLVTLGGVLFAGLCGLSLLTVGSAVAWLLPPALAMAIWAWLGRRRRPGDDCSGPGRGVFAYTDSSVTRDGHLRRERFCDPGRVH